MKLFKLVNYNLSIDDEAYLLLPFKALWDRDRSKNKELAQAELAYIFFMEDFNSDFFTILDEAERKEEVKRNLSLPSNWQEDTAVLEAREFYRDKTQNTYSLLLLKDVRGALDKIREFLRDADPIKNINQLLSTTQKVGELLIQIDKLEDKVKRDLQDQSKIVGSKTKAIFEDGLK